MRVKMRQRISGTRNGQPWPVVGEVLDIPDAEAASLVALGYAEKANGEVEAAVAPAPAETAAVNTVPKKRGGTRGPAKSG